MRVTALLLSAILLASCTAIEQHDPLESRLQGIRDAQSAPKELELFYMSCFSLPPYEKERCHISAMASYPPLQSATPEYIRAFADTIERNAFTSFIKEQGFPCPMILEPPTTDSGALYEVECIGQIRYRLTHRKGRWSLLK